MNPIRAHALADEQELKRFREMSLAEKGRLLHAACRAAVALEQARLRAGLPPSHPAPWPQSTLDFFRSQIAHGERT